MPTLEQRRLVRLGGSIIIALPRGWLAYHRLKPGELVKVITNGDLRIVPLKRRRGHAKIQG